MKNKVENTIIEDYKRKLQELNNSDLNHLNKDVQDENFEVKSNGSNKNSVGWRRGKRNSNDYGTLKVSMNIKDSVLKQKSLSRSRLSSNGSMTSSHKQSRDMKIGYARVGLKNQNARRMEVKA